MVEHYCNKIPILFECYTVYDTIITYYTIILYNQYHRMDFYFTARRDSVGGWLAAFGNSAMDGDAIVTLSFVGHMKVHVIATVINSIRLLSSGKD